MKKSEVPPNWAELVEKSSEKVTDEDYDLAKTWLFPDADIDDIAMQQTTTQELVLEILATFFKQCSHLDIMHYLDTRLIFPDPTMQRNISRGFYPTSIFGFSHRLFAIA